MSISAHAGGNRYFSVKFRSFQRSSGSPAIAAVGIGYIRILKKVMILVSGLEIQGFGRSWDNTMTEF